MGDRRSRAGEPRPLPRLNPARASASRACRVSGCPRRNATRADADSTAAGRGRPSPWLAAQKRTRMQVGIPRHPTESLVIPVVVVQERELGTWLRERRDALPGTLLRTWLDERVLPAFAERILPMDTAVAQRSAAPQVSDPRPIRDALIAATARVHGLAVVPRTMRDFAPMQIAPLNPWRDGIAIVWPVSIPNSGNRT